MESGELRKEVEHRLNGGSTVQFLASTPNQGSVAETTPPSASATVNPVGMSAELEGVRGRSVWWRIFSVIINPWRAWSLYQQMREQERLETLSRVEVARGDLTYQDVEIRLSGKLLSNRKVQELLREGGNRRENPFQTTFGKTHRA